MTDFTTIGLDIGGTKLKALALSRGHSIIHELEVPSLASEGPGAVRSALKDVLQAFRARGVQPQAIGVGCAGAVHPITGVVRNSPNFKAWKDIPLKQWIEEDSGLPATADNDANCAMVAEWKLGAGVGLNHFVLLTLGTGVGGGVLVDGRVLRGATGTAGELGHLAIHAGGDPCPCGSQGCFERYCSGTAIRRNAGDVSSRIVFQQPIDPRFQPVVDRFLADFRSALVSLANTFDPQAILLGGQVSLGVAPYLPELEAWVKAHAFPSVAENIRILPAQYGNMAGSLGAALLAVELLQAK